MRPGLMGRGDGKRERAAISGIPLSAAQRVIVGVTLGGFMTS